MGGGDELGKQSGGTFSGWKWYPAVVCCSVSRIREGKAEKRGGGLAVFLSASLAAYFFLYRQVRANIMRRYLYVIPSLFSLLRLVLAVCLPFSPERFWVYLIIGAALSDFFDGWFARRFHVQSWQGGLLDGLADKVFILLTLIVFVLAGKFHLLWILPVMIRDMIVGITVFYVIFCKRWQAFKDMDARISGKLTTGGQFILFIVVLLFPEKTLYALLFASCCSIAAGLDYGWLFYRALSRQSR